MYFTDGMRTQFFRNRTGRSGDGFQDLSCVGGKNLLLDFESIAWALEMSQVLSRLNDAFGFNWDYQTSRVGDINWRKVDS